MFVRVWNPLGGIKALPLSLHFHGICVLCFIRGLKPLYKNENFLASLTFIPKSSLTSFHKAAGLTTVVYIYSPLTPFMNFKRHKRELHHMPTFSVSTPVS